MKKPRVNDFDPNASKLKSPLDGMPSIQKPAASQAQPLAPVTSQTPTETRVLEVPNERSNERTVERKRIRHTFDIRSDQLISLREISINREKGFGKRVLLGDLVQEALDSLITKERNKE